MPDEERKNQGEDDSRPAGAGEKIEVRPRNWLVPVILLTLTECASYGYELMERTARFGFEALNPGTLYRTLRRMERDGLCESSWDTTGGGGPARWMYSITDAGEAYLRFWAEALEEYRRNMDAFFRLYLGASHRHARTGRKTTGRSVIPRFDGACGTARNSPR